MTKFIKYPVIWAQQKLTVLITFLHFRSSSCNLIKTWQGGIIKFTKIARFSMTAYEIAYQMNQIVRVSVIIHYLQLKILTVSSNFCYEAERSQQGYALLNTTYSSKPTVSYLACLELCIDDPRCISFNFWWNTRQCDLNSWSREICQACYVKASSTYMGMASVKGKILFKN